MKNASAIVAAIREESQATMVIPRKSACADAERAIQPPSPSNIEHQHMVGPNALLYFCFMCVVKPVTTLRRRKNCLRRGFAESAQRRDLLAQTFHLDFFAAQYRAHIAAFGRRGI